MSDLFTFRKYKKKQGQKKVKHPKLIVDDYGNEYGFMGLTSQKRKGKGHNNHPLKYNPEIVNGKRKTEKAYLRRKVEYDNKKKFGAISKNYVLHDEDKKDLIPIVNRRKKKR